MGRTVRELQDQLSAADFAEYVAFYNIEPFGDQWQDYRFGLLTAALKNSWRDPDSTAYQPSDFFSTLKSSAPDPVSVADKVRAVMASITQRMMRGTPG